ncbi:hypothetical protein CLIB1423_07S01134 [[Candida] railenensis]|uniref:Uncharacterized protein n=1 Tax=[Candida] railenensis TaxID=45579 RepID=A0A9P0VYH2_9ASCO|nr:hypothetical protein CLIB1423_07S01134 [[Candida] railenensis]
MSEPPPPQYTKEAKDVEGATDTAEIMMEAPCSFLGHIWILYFLSCVIFSVYILSLFSCSARIPYCNSQFNFLINSDSRSSKKLLTNIQETLDMVSFLVKDFGTVYITDQENSLIDTFSYLNEYKFNFNGFCRLANHKTTCYSGSMDIFSCWMRDIGHQLGTLSRKNSKELNLLGESFVAAYGNLLRALYDICSETESEEGVTGREYSTLSKMIHGLVNSHRYAKLMTAVSYATIFLSLSKIFILGSCIIFYKYPAKIGATLFKMMVSFQVFVFVSVLLNFSLCSSVLIYYFQLIEVFHQIGFAEITLGSGWFMIQFNFVVLLAIQALLLHYFVRRYRAKKSQYVAA